MATGTIKNTIPKLKSIGAVSVPYTPPVSGLLLVALNPTSSAGGYAILNAGGVNYVFNAANSTTTSTSLPIVGGTRITETAVSGVTPTYYAFLFD